MKSLQASSKSWKTLVKKETPGDLRHPMHNYFLNKNSGESQEGSEKDIRDLKENTAQKSNIFNYS